MTKRILSVFPALFIMIVIFCFSSQTAAQSSKISNSLLLAILNSIPFVSDYSANIYEYLTFFIRKLAHFTLYFMLGISYLFMWKNILKKQTFKKTILLSLLCSFLYAATDEFHQYFIPGRSCEFRDILIDLAGAATGCVFILAAGFLKDKIKYKQKESV